MAVYANTTLANITIPLLWDQDLLEARYANAVIMPRVLNRSEKVSKFGQQLSIPIKPRYTAGTVTAATGGFTPQNTAPTQANIIVNLWYQVSVEVTDQTRAQSFWDPTNDFAKDAGKALAIQVDSSLANLYTGLTDLSAVGDNDTGSVFDDNMARTALLRLANANIPLNNLSFIIPPVGMYGGWLTKTELTAAYATGLDKSAQITGKMSDVLGTPTFMSTVLTNTGTVIKGFLIHKEAFGIGMQINHEYKIADRTSALILSKVAVVDDLWGTVNVRTDHGVVLNVSPGAA